MKADLKAKWLTALRSDKYTQGQGFLRGGDDTFCCLGVLCEVAGFEWRDPTEEDDEAAGVFVTGESDGSEHLNHDEYVALGLDDEQAAEGDFTFSETRSTRLSQMNDDGSDFSEIADWIEENVPVT